MAPVFPDESCSETSPLKKWLVGWGWVFFLVQTVAMIYIFVSRVSLTDPQWGFYANAWCPLAWSRILIMLLTMIVVDWMFPGHTISAILDIECESKPEDKRTAMWFLLGVGALTVWCMSGVLGGLQQ